MNKILPMLAVTCCMLTLPTTYAVGNESLEETTVGVVKQQTYIKTESDNSEEIAKMSFNQAISQLGASNIEFGNGGDNVQLDYKGLNLTLMAGMGLGDNSCLEPQQCDENNFVYGLGFGYQFENNAFINVDYVDFWPKQRNSSDDIEYSNINSINISGGYAWNFKEDFNLEFEAGIALWQQNFIGQDSNLTNSSNLTGVSPKVGLNFTYNMGDNWRVGTKLQHIRGIGGTDTNETLALLSLSFFFGNSNSNSNQYSVKVNNTNYFTAPVPVPQTQIIEKATIPNSYDIYFDFDSAEFKHQYRKVLESVRKLMTENDKLKLTFIGYTDDVGSLHYNKALSMKRIKSVEVELFKDSSLDSKTFTIDRLNVANDFYNIKNKGKASYKERKVRILFEK